MAGMRKHESVDGFDLVSKTPEIAFIERIESIWMD